MLSRSAQGLYWMGRYLERTEHLCRLLQFQIEALVDRSIREIYFGWSRIYTSLNRQPPGGSLELGESDAYTLADSCTLAGDLTFEHSNLDSIRSCFAIVRENARQMRHCISTEMWVCLNLTWLHIRDLDIKDIWKTSPENFYMETARDIYTFTGIAEATMYREEGWRFMRLGRSIERAQLLVALLLAQFTVSQSKDEAFGADWTSLLRACQAFEAYKSNYSVEVQPAQALDLLVADPLLPGSLYNLLNAVAMEKAAIGAGSGSRASSAAERLAGRLNALVRYEWPDRNNDEALLKQVQEHCHNLHTLIIEAYVDYAIEGAPTR